MAKRTKAQRRARRKRTMKAIGKGLRKASSATKRGITYLQSPEGRKRSRQVVSAIRKYGGKHGKTILKYAHKGAKHAGHIAKAAEFAGKAGKYLM